MRFIELKPLPEALIFAYIGLTTGILQWTILRKYFSRSFFWILASILGWGICILITQIHLAAFFIGTLLYGAITGATLMWILQIKDEVVDK